MSIKVVHGLINYSKPETQNIREQSTSLLKSTAVVSSQANTDAVNLNLRAATQKSNQSAKKVEDIKDAKNLSDNIAEKILKTEDGALSAHDSLSYTSSAKQQTL